MAIVDRAFWNVSVAFEDNNRKLSVTGFYLSGALSYADAVDDAGAIIAAMQGASDARLESWAITRGFFNDDVTVPPASSEVERKLSITLGNATFKSISRIELPSPIFGMEQPRSDAPAPDNAAWLALQTALLGSLVTPGTGVTDYRGVPATRITRAAFVHRYREPN